MTDEGVLDERGSVDQADQLAVKRVGVIGGGTTGVDDGRRRPEIRDRIGGANA